MEIIITVIILGILASLAIPIYTVNVEKAKSSEGAQILEAVLNAQRRHFLEYNDFVEGQNINLLDLDIELGPGTGNFDPPAAFANPDKLASIDRSNGSYSLFIDSDGDIYCENLAGPDICSKLPYDEYIP